MDNNELHIFGRTKAECSDYGGLQTRWLELKIDQDQQGQYWLYWGSDKMPHTWPISMNMDYDSITEQQSDLEKYYDLVAAENFGDLDWSDCLLETIECGWISPDAKFYGCPHGGHDHLIHDKLGYASYRSIEGKGWIKITRENWLSFECTPTAEQRRVISKIGRDPDNWRSPWDRSVEFKQAFPNGYGRTLIDLKKQKEGRHKSISADDAVVFLLANATPKTPALPPPFP